MTERESEKKREFSNFIYKVITFQKGKITMPSPREGKSASTLHMEMPLNKLMGTEAEF